MDTHRPSAGSARRPAAAPSASGRAGGDRRPATAGTWRRVLTVAAAVLAVAGLLSLGMVLLAALGSAAVWPGFAAGSIYLLPVAFLLMAGLVIDGIRRRRRG